MPEPEHVVVLPAGVDVWRIVVRHAEVSFRDANDREVLLVDRPTHPGAGLGLQVADHVEVAS